MEKLLEIGNKYAEKSNWKDFSLVKFCLCAIGIIIGTFIPKNKKKDVRIILGFVFGITYIALMTKVIKVMKSLNIRCKGN